jgi:hypothetical protein
MISWDGKKRKYWGISFRLSRVDSGWVTKCRPSSQHSKYLTQSSLQQFATVWIRKSRSIWLISWPQLWGGLCLQLEHHFSTTGRGKTFLACHARRSPEGWLMLGFTTVVKWNRWDLMAAAPPESYL